MREKLGNSSELSVKDLLDLEVEFSNICVKRILHFCNGIDNRVNYISSHGHTVLHYPEKGHTLQIGKGSIIAEGVGIPCIVDLRSNDIALGGQGAPVAPIVEQYLYPGYDVYFNLGGIANISVHNNGRIVSIDSCPCNQVLNYLANKKGISYDDKGELARKGSVIEQLINKWSTIEYFARPIPKSMDNSWVKSIFISELDKMNVTIENGLATMVEFCAIQLSRDIKILDQNDQKLDRKGFITGGGAFNDYLVERIQFHSSSLGLTNTLPDSETINFKEAILMALMGYLRIQEIPNTIPSVTGAKKATVGGAIYLSSPRH